MSQIPIQETLQAILGQLHSSQYQMTANTKRAGTLTAMEIAQILSGQTQSHSTSEEGAQSQEPTQLPQVTVFIADKEPFEQDLRDANTLCQIHYYRPIYSCRKWIGGCIVFGKKVARKLLKFLIEPIVEEQNQFNAATVRTLNDIRNHRVVFQAATDYLCQETRKQAQALDGLRNESTQALQALSGETNSQLEQLREQLSKAMELLQQQSEEMQRLTQVQTEDDIYDKIDYFKFQEHMRGSCTAIKDRQQSYLPYFEQCQSVVDLGCGRGEFLEVLREHGVGAVGVDSYGKSIEYCRMKGLQASEGDAIQFLCNQKENSIDGIFAAQLIEHIPAGKILELCRESYRVMKPGSYIVLETPNPMCLSVYMNSFYLDPSHKNPVHPHLMEYFMQECGFRNVQVVYVKESKVNYRFPLLHAENCDNLEEFNDGINFLSDIMFGSQDYAIVAQK